MKRLLIPLLLLGLPAFAGGPTTDFAEDGPCDVPFPTWEVWSKSWVSDDGPRFYALAQGNYEALCGAPIQIGEKLREIGFTDEELLQYVFSGHHVPIGGGGGGKQPAPVPLSDPWVYLVFGLFSLVLLKWWTKK
jgi:hypothetical protein